LPLKPCTRRSIGSVWQKTNRQDPAAGVSAAPGEPSESLAGF
jgi:hypothetical protein